MKLTFRIFITIALFTLFIPNLTKAQPRTGEFINASIGIGFSSSYYDEDYGNQKEEDVMGGGLYVQGEYVLAMTSWFGIRPYAGLIVTSADKNQNNDLGNQPQYKVTSTAFLVGGKARLCAPIPWVAPFVEVGVGASFGSFQTFTPSRDIKKNGAQIHIPVGFGLAVGRKNNIEIGVNYYFHPGVDQFSGGLSAGFTFPINEN